MRIRWLIRHVVNHRVAAILIDIFARCFIGQDIRDFSIALVCNDKLVNAYASNLQRWHHVCLDIFNAHRLSYRLLHDLERSKLVLDVAAFFDAVVTHCGYEIEI